jgi:hypothetical protein
MVNVIKKIKARLKIAFLINNIGFKIHLSFFPPLKFFQNTTIYYLLIIIIKTTKFFNNLVQIVFPASEHFDLIIITMIINLQI